MMIITFEDDFFIHDKDVEFEKQLREHRCVFPDACFVCVDACISITQEYVKAKKQFDKQKFLKCKCEQRRFVIFEKLLSLGVPVPLVNIEDFPLMMTHSKTKLTYKWCCRYQAVDFNMRLIDTKIRDLEFLLDNIDGSLEVVRENCRDCFAR